MARNEQLAEANTRRAEAKKAESRDKEKAKKAEAAEKPAKVAAGKLDLPKPTSFERVEIKTLVLDGNCRKQVDFATIGVLAASMMRHGQLVPVIVHMPVSAKQMGKPVLVCGYRRLAAAKSLGWLYVDAIVYPKLTPEQVRDVQLVENLHREDLPAMDEAEAIGQMLKAEGQAGTYGETCPEAEEIAALLAMPVERVRRRVKLLRLCDRARAMVVPRGMLPVAHAEVIAACEPEAQLEVAQWAVRQTATKYGDKDAGKVEEGGLDRRNYIRPLPEVREAVSARLGTLAGKGWSMDQSYAGERACEGCRYNSITTPTLFEGLARPGKVNEKRGFCSNQTCFATKLKQTAKDKEQKKKAKAGVEPEAATAGPSPGEGTEDSKKVDAAWIKSPQGKAHRELHRWCRGVGKAAAAATHQIKGRKREDLVIVLLRRASRVLGLEGARLTPEADAKATAAVFAKGAPQHLAQARLEAMTKSNLLGRYSPGHGSLLPERWSKLSEYDVAYIDMVEAFAKWLGVKVEPRPVTVEALELDKKDE